MHISFLNIVNPLKGKLGYITKSITISKPFNIILCNTKYIICIISVVANLIIVHSKNFYSKYKEIEILPKWTGLTKE